MSSKSEEQLISTAEVTPCQLCQVLRLSYQCLEADMLIDLFKASLQPMLNLGLDRLARS